jgi:intracellular multiplication protein IcmP
MSAPKEDVEPVWIIWHYVKPQALEAIRYLHIGELEIVRLFTNQDDACAHWLRIVPYGTATPTPDVVQATQDCFGAGDLAQLPPDEAAPYYSLTPTSTWEIGRHVSRYWHLPFAALFAGIAGYIFFFSPRNRFKKFLNLESFIRIQARMWSVINPIVNFNPAKYSARAPGDMVPDQLPPFAEALSPEEWIAWHRIPVTNGVPEREAMRRAFLLQLGPRWNGIEATPPYIQALFAAFALKAAQKREESDDLLGRVSLCWDVKKGFHMPAKLNDEIRRIVRDSKISTPALHITNQHAYRATALLGLLKWARMQGGVLAPAQFLWLRALDRALWYPLNNIGRRSFHTEGAGAMAHFMAEQNAKKPLPIPRIDTAIVTLNQYLATNGQPIPPREEPSSGSGRKGKK